MNNNRKLTKVSLDKIVRCYTKEEKHLIYTHGCPPSSLKYSYQQEYRTWEKHISELLEKITIQTGSCVFFIQLGPKALLSYSRG